MRYKVLFLLLFLGLGSHELLVAQSSDPDIAQVRALLQQQQDAWNRGDIDAFMQAYWKSDQLQFVGGNGITLGWQNTLDNYKKRYPNRSAMGQLTFGVVSVEKLSKKVIFLIGTWNLKRDADQPGGYYNLLWKKIAGRWVIVTDHTSSRG
jgi:ketosteroid isomerase-like protein